MSDVSPKQLLQARLVIRLHRAQQRKRIAEAKMAYYQETLAVWTAIDAHQEIDQLEKDPLEMREDMEALDQEIERLEQALEYLSS